MPFKTNVQAGSEPVATQRRSLAEPRVELALILTLGDIDSAAPLASRTNCFKTFRSNGQFLAQSIAARAMSTVFDLEEIRSVWLEFLGVCLGDSAFHV